MIRSFALPNPAVGTDWSWTVPGQYNARLLGVTANLAPVGNPTSAPDSTGNAHVGTYNQTRTGLTFGLTGPFGAGGGQAMAATGTPSNPGYSVLIPNAGAFDTADFTVECVAWMDALGGFFALETLLCERTTAPNTRWIVGAQFVNPTGQLRCANNNASVFSLGPAFSANAWHHLAVTQTGGTWTPYVDGVAGGAVAGRAINVGINGQPVTIGGDNNVSSQDWQGKLAALAFYGTAIPAANIAAHQAQIAVSSAAYKAAVLADTPVALWMLDDLTTHFQRTAVLTITDGTSVVASFPGFQSSDQQTTFRWTWATNAAGNLQTTNQQTTIIAIPAVDLPPGYVVKATTIDLTSLDQWSNVVVWADVSDSGSVDGGYGDGGHATTFVGGILTPDYGGRFH